jgi:hypothetical protein
VPAPAERRVARTLLKRHGHSDTGVPLVWDNPEAVPEGLPVDMVEVRPPPPQDTLPYQPYGVGIHMRADDASRYAKVLRRLKDRPVVLTGGGGGGASWAFLRSVHLARRGDESTVQVCVCPLPGDRGAKAHGIVSPVVQDRKDRKPFCPYVGSWRIHAVHGHGAEDLP